MHHIKQKLQSNRGASMLLALMYLLLCITIGTFVITAASTSSGHAPRIWQTEQNYQTVASATKLLTADLKNAVYTGAYKKIETSVYYPAVLGDEGNIVSDAYTEELPVIYILAIPEPSIVNSQLLATLEKTADDNDFDLLYRSTLPIDAVEIYLALNENDNSIQYPLNFSAVGNLPAVNGKLTVYNSTGTTTPLYTITAELWLGTADGGEKQNTTKLTFSPIVTEQIPVVEVETISTETSVTTITTTTYTTEVRWNAPAITKGGAV